MKHFGGRESMACYVNGLASKFVTGRHRPILAYFCQPDEYISKGSFVFHTTNS